MIYFQMDFCCANVGFKDFFGCGSEAPVSEDRAEALNIDRSVGGRNFQKHY